MSTAVIDKLVVKLMGDSSDFVRMVENTKQQVNDLSSKLTSMGRSLSMKVTAPIAAFEGVAVASFLSFDKAMTQSTAIMGDLSEETVKAMKEQAIALSEQGGHSAAQLAEAYFFLASAGLDAEQQMAALPQVAAFAAAGQFDLSTATDLATDAQSALGLTVDDAAQNLENLTRVTDVLVKANTLSNASVDQFSRALTRKAGTALKSVNKDIEEGVAVLAVYADQGIKSANAGEKLTALFRELQMQSRKNNEEFKKYKITIDDGNGGLLNTADIVAQMEKSLGSLSVVEREAALAAMGFRAEAQAAILPLLGNSEALREYEGELKKAAGTTNEVASKQGKALVNVLQVTRNILQNVAMDVGEQLVPKIEFMNDVTKRAALAFRGLDSSTKQTIVAIGSFAAALGPTLVALGAVVGMLSNLAPVAAAAGVAINALRGKFVAMWISALGPALIVVAKFALIAGAIGGLMYLLIGPEGIAAGFDKAKEGIGRFVQGAKGFIHNFRHNMGEAFGFVRKLASAVWEQATTNTGTFVKTAIGFIGRVVKMVPRLLAVVIGFVAANFIPMVVKGITKAVTFLHETMKTVGGMIRDVFVQLPSMAWTALKTIGTFVIDVFKAALNFVWGMFKGLVSLVSGLFMALFTGDFLGALKTGISLMWEAFTGFFEKVGEAIYRLLSLDFDYLKKLAGDATAGATADNLGDELKRIMGEEMDGFDFGGFTGGNMPDLPEFNFNIPEDGFPLDTSELDNMAKDANKAAEAVTEATEEQVKQANEEKEKEDEEKKSNGGMTAEQQAGFSAVEVGSAEAYRLMTQGRSGRVQEDQLTQLRRIGDATEQANENAKQTKNMTAANFEGE